MRRWTNGLPGATQRLGAMMTQRGLTASQPWMRADPHRGPEHNRSTSQAEYIDAAFTFALSELHLAPHGRAIHLGTTLPSGNRRARSARRPKAAMESSRRNGRVVPQPDSRRSQKPLSSYFTLVSPTARPATPRIVS